MAKSIDKAVDKDMEQFQNDLLQSVRQMKAGKAARTSVVALTPAAEARTKVGVSQSEFARLGARSTRTIGCCQDVAAHCCAFTGGDQAGDVNNCILNVANPAKLHDEQRTS